jgi:hypothetical protein
MKNLKYLFMALSVMVLIIADLHAQTPRLVGGRRFVLDNNDLITTNNVYLIDNVGSLGINNAGNITGTFPNTSALVTLFAGSKTTNLFIDGGPTWGIDVANTNNSIRTSGRSIFGDDAGVDDATFNLGTGLFHTTGTLPTTSSNGTTNVRINTLAGPPQISPALTAQDGIVIAGTNGDLKKYDVSILSAAAAASPFADFFALMPGDNAATIAINAAVLFPQNGPTSGATIARTSSSTFQLANVGTYEILFQVSVTEAGQLGLRLNGSVIANSVVGRAAGTTQITEMCLVTTVVPNSILEVINSSSAAALTITPSAGGTMSVSAHLVIKRLQ